MEFHAVILCGQGKGLVPFSSLRSTGQAKAMLPIANKPMISHVLEWCNKASFKEITVVCHPTALEAISNTVGKYIPTSTFPNQKINVISGSSESTGEILRTISPKLNGDFIILPCDFITDLDPHVLLEVYRNRKQDQIAISIHYNNSIESIEKKNLKSNYTIHTPINITNSILLDVYSKESTDVSKIFKIRNKMISSHPHSVISTQLLDSFIYMCSSRIIEISDINEEGNDISSLRPVPKVIRDFARRSWQHREPKESIGFFVIPEQSTFIRVSSLPAYIESNRFVIKQRLAKLVESGETPGRGSDCVIGENTTIGEKTNIKKSAIGNNCLVGKSNRLIGCVILDNTIIGDGVQLENCIIGTNVQIESRVKLTSCNVEGSYVVKKGTQAKGETIVNFSLEGLDEDMVEEFSSESSEEYDEDEDEDIEEDENEFSGDDIFSR